MIKCLILDHDDTVVQSSREIHYPAFVETLRQLRPEVHYDFKTYMKINFDPGLLEFMRQDLHFSEKEMSYELDLWRSMVNLIVPDLYPGMREAIEYFKAGGGKIVVSSHSYQAFVQRDYLHHFGFEPDMIFAGDSRAELIKPSMQSMNTVFQAFHVNAAECLVVDDLKPGYIMAKQAHIPFAAAGYSIINPEVQDFFLTNSDYYFQQSDDLLTLLQADPS